MTQQDKQQPIWKHHVLLTGILSTIIFAYQAPWYSYLTQRQLSSSESRRFVALVKDPENLCRLLKSRSEKKPDDIAARRLMSNCNAQIAKTVTSRQSLQASNRTQGSAYWQRPIINNHLTKNHREIRFQKS